MYPVSSLFPHVSNRKQRPEDRAAVLWHVLSHGSSRVHRFMEGDGWVFLPLYPDVSVAAASLARRSCFAGDEDAAWQALGVLLDGLSRSASNAQFKLLLLLLYCHLGAFEPVVDLYYNLDAKHVQHDTIGSVPSEADWDHLKTEIQLSSCRRRVFFYSCRFLLTRYAESLGQFAAASQSCNFSLRFFHSNQKDVSLTRSFLWKPEITSDAHSK